MIECFDGVRLDARAIGEGDLLRLIGTILLVLPLSDSRSDWVPTLFGRYGSDGEREEIEDWEAR